jgi:hypothetical protein
MKRVLDISEILSVGVKLPVQVMLSLLVIAVSVTLGVEMSVLLEKPLTTSEKTSVSVALSPGLSAESMLLVLV